LNAAEPCTGKVNPWVINLLAITNPSVIKLAAPVSRPLRSR